MEHDDKLRLDYEETNRYFRLLADIRFKLLAFVPTVSGVAITLVSKTATPEIGILVGLLGLSVTLGIVTYELRNTQFYDASVHRAKSLEVLLGFTVCTKGKVVGGLFNERPGRIRLLWKIDLWHDLGLALVYGASFGGWVYLIVDTSSILIGRPSYAVSLALSAIFAIAFAWTFLRIGAMNKPQFTDDIKVLTQPKS